MSADNWAKCPRCVKEAKVVLQNLSQQISVSYGVVSVEEFDQMRDSLVKKLEALKEGDNYRTFREDYEFYGAEDGAITVSYKGNCAKCGLKLEFVEEHPIPGV